MSPYNVDKQLGGDNPANDKFMEDCVMKVMKTGKNKQSAIMICKVSLRKHIANKRKTMMNNSSLTFHIEDI